MTIISKEKKIIYDNIFNFNTFITSIVSILIGFLVNSLGSNYNIPSFIFFGYIIISLVIFWYLLIKLNNKDFSQNSYIGIEISKFSTQNKKIVCILKACEHLTLNTYLTFYCMDDGLENYISTAIITNIQHNKLIQVELISPIPTTTLNLMKNNNVDFINKIVIKPIITQNYFDERSA
nr:hypothetical protein [[Eubacterium] tenue]